MATKEQINFIESIAKLVQKYAPKYQIKVCSPIIAQAILESGWGKSTLASKYHNYFGLKCGSGWKGKSVNMATKEEYSPGTLTSIRDNFRVFDSMEDGIKGYFEFIQYTRYHNLRGITDPYKYIETIRADGYATSSTYVQNLWKVVTTYELTKYDNAGKKVTKVSYDRNKVVKIMQSWIGKKESNGSHHVIIDIYNQIKPLPMGWKMTYSAAWCAATVSAAFHKAGYDAIFPAECGCGRMIDKAKQMGIWKESDSYVPSPGDCIMYDWDDGANYAKYDNTGAPDHVGMVESVSGKTITIIEGNMGSRVVGRRKIEVNGRYIRGYITPKFSSESTNTSQSSNSSSSKKKSTVAKVAASYKVGKEYTVSTDYLNVRTGPGTNYERKTKKQLTADGQKHSNKSGQLMKGTVVTCLKVKTNGSNVWIQIPSGWICAYYGTGKEYYVK